MPTIANNSTQTPNLVDHCFVCLDDDSEKVYTGKAFCPNEGDRLQEIKDGVKVGIHGAVHQDCLDNAVQAMSNACPICRMPDIGTFDIPQAAEPNPDSFTPSQAVERMAAAITIFRAPETSDQERITAVLYVSILDTLLEGAGFTREQIVGALNAHEQNQRGGAELVESMATRLREKALIFTGAGTMLVSLGLRFAQLSGDNTAQAISGSLIIASGLYGIIQHRSFVQKLTSISSLVVGTSTLYASVKVGIASSWWPTQTMAV